MKVYIVAVEDRHVDLELQVHLSPERAIDEAKARAKELSDDVSYEELDPSEYEHLIFCARYSFEGNYVSVYESEIVE